MSEKGLYPLVNKFFVENGITLPELSLNTKNTDLYGFQIQPDFLGVAVEENKGKKFTRVYLGEVKTNLLDLDREGVSQGRGYRRFADFVFLALPESEWNSSNVSNTDRDKFLLECENNDFGLLVINPTKWIIEPPRIHSVSLKNKLRIALKIFFATFEDNNYAQQILLQSLYELGGEAYFSLIIANLGSQGDEILYSDVIREVTSLELSKQGLRRQANQLMHRGLVTIDRDKKDRLRDFFKITESGRNVSSPPFLTNLFLEIEEESDKKGMEAGLLEMGVEFPDKKYKQIYIDVLYEKSLENARDILNIAKENADRANRDEILPEDMFEILPILEDGLIDLKSKDFIAEVEKRYREEV